MVPAPLNDRVIALTIAALGGAIATTVGSRVASEVLLPHPVKGNEDAPWLAAMAVSIFGGIGAIYAGVEMLGSRSPLGVGLALGGAVLLGTGMTLASRRAELAHATSA